MNRPYNWLPRQGVPLNNYERFSQTAIKVIAWLPVYTAIVVTLVLLLEIFGIPFVKGS
jgi:hypothetical protein